MRFKNLRLKGKTFFLFFLGLIVVVEASFLLLKGNIASGTKDFSEKPQNPTLGLQFGDFAEHRTRWGKGMDEVGADNTYTEFKDEFAEETYGVQHSAAHIFGELLYNKLGIEGISVCDSSFAFGCYHAFFGKAVAVEGIDVLPKFHQACIEKFGDLSLPCRHGIGHGILTYLGEDELFPALERCASLSDEVMGGCTSGVFMEYNFRTMQDPTGSSILTRPLDKNDVYSPCSTLPEQFQQSCYFEQTQWWESVFAGDYEKIGQMCGQVVGEKERSACFLGAGNYIAPFSGHDVEKTIVLCNKMPSVEATALCTEAASWIFLGLDGRKDDAFKLCQNLDGVEEKTCIQKLNDNPFSKV